MGNSCQLGGNLQNSRDFRNFQAFAVYIVKLCPLRALWLRHRTIVNVIWVGTELQDLGRTPFAAAPHNITRMAPIQDWQELIAAI